MFVKIVRRRADEALLSQSQQLLMLAGEPAALFQVEECGDEVELSRVVGERRLRQPPRCGPWRRELLCGASRQ
jgi:hypothetical protein